MLLLVFVDLHCRQKASPENFRTVWPGCGAPEVRGPEKILQDSPNYCQKSFLVEQINYEIQIRKTPFLFFLNRPCPKRFFREGQNLSEHRALSSPRSWKKGLLLRCFL